MNSKNRYSSKLTQTVNFQPNHQIDRLQYDRNQKFVLYFDVVQNSILWFDLSLVLFSTL